MGIASRVDDDDDRAPLLVDARRHGRVDPPDPGPSTAPYPAYATAAAHRRPDDQPPPAAMSSYDYRAASDSSRYGAAASDDGRSVRDGGSTVSGTTAMTAASNASSSSTRQQLPSLSSLFGPPGPPPVRSLNSPSASAAAPGPPASGSPLDRHPSSAAQSDQPPTSSSYFPPSVSPRSAYDHQQYYGGSSTSSRGPPSPRSRELDYQRHNHHHAPAPHHHHSGSGGHYPPPPPPPPPSHHHQLHQQQQQHHQQPDYPSSKWTVQHDLKSEYAAASSQIFGTYRAPHERVPLYLSGQSGAAAPSSASSTSYDQDSAYGGSTAAAAAAGGPDRDAMGRTSMHHHHSHHAAPSVDHQQHRMLPNPPAPVDGAAAHQQQQPPAVVVSIPVPMAGTGSSKDGLGPKIWTGTHFLPRFVRAAEVPGEGLCYFYDDGSHCKTVIDGEAVNAHWGVTKAGKPRKRLAIACITCREKKIKCDPDYPRCVQCEKFGRQCQFKNAPRGGGPHSGSPSSPPSELATDGHFRARGTTPPPLLSSSSSSSRQPQQQQLHHGHMGRPGSASSASGSPRTTQMRHTSSPPPGAFDHSGNAKRLRTGYDGGYATPSSTTTETGSAAHHHHLPPPPRPNSSVDFGGGGGGRRRLPTPERSGSAGAMPSSTRIMDDYEIARLRVLNRQAAGADDGPMPGGAGGGAAAGGGSAVETASLSSSALDRAWQTDPYVSDPSRAFALTSSFFAHVDSTALRFLPRAVFSSWLFGDGGVVGVGGRRVVPATATAPARGDVEVERVADQDEEEEVPERVAHVHGGGGGRVGVEGRGDDGDAPEDEGAEAEKQAGGDGGEHATTTTPAARRCADDEILGGGAVANDAGDGAADDEEKEVGASNSNARDHVVVDALEKPDPNAAVRVEEQKQNEGNGALDASVAASAARNVVDGKNDRSSSTAVTVTSTNPPATVSKASANSNNTITSSPSSNSNREPPRVGAEIRSGSASNAHRKSPEDLMLIYSVLAVGAAFLHREHLVRAMREEEEEEKEADEAATRYDELGRSEDAPKNSTDVDSHRAQRTLHLQARRLGHYYAAVCRHAQQRAGLSLQVVQARVLLSLFYLMVGQPCDSIEISGGAISAAVCMGLNLEMQDDEDDDEERQDADDDDDDAPAAVVTDADGDVDMTTAAEEEEAPESPKDALAAAVAKKRARDKDRYPWGMTREQYRECRRRTYWACFVYERLDGSFPTRLSNLAAEDVFIRVPSLERAFEEQAAVEVAKPANREEEQQKARDDHDEDADHADDDDSARVQGLGPMFDPSLASLALLEPGSTTDSESSPSPAQPAIGSLGMLVPVVVVWGDVMSNVYRMCQRHRRGPLSAPVDLAFADFYARSTARLDRWIGAARAHGLDLLCGGGPPEDGQAEDEKSAAVREEAQRAVVRRAVDEGTLSSLLTAHLVYHVTAIKLHRHVSPRFWKVAKADKAAAKLTKARFAAAARRHAVAVLDVVRAAAPPILAAFERHSRDALLPRPDVVVDVAEAASALILPPPFLSSAVLEAADVLSASGVVGADPELLPRIVAGLATALDVLAVLADVWEAARFQADLVDARLAKLRAVLHAAEEMKAGGGGDATIPPTAVAGVNFFVRRDATSDGRENKPVLCWSVPQPVDKRFAKSMDTVYTVDPWVSG